MSVLTPQQIWIQARLPPRCTPGRNLVSRTQPVPITLFLSGRADGASGTTRRDFNVRTVQCGSYRTGSKVARTHTRTGYAYLSSFACRTSNESLSQQKNLDSTSRVTCGHVCPVARCSRMRCATISLTPSPRLMRWPWTLATACHTSAPWSTLNMLICSRESASLCHLRLSSWNAKKECALYGSTSIRYRRHPGSSVLSVCQESNPPGGYQNSPRKLSDADADRNPGCCLLRFSTAFWRRELHGPPEIHPPDLDGPRWSSLNRPDTRPAAPNTSPAPPVTSYAADETGELVPTSCVL
mmetsp:Transcript_10357/g.21294  ORF Transcript_10357/g.21294 Transcript_10357/m.21294 type:complete len:297 (-) Transcript_10357:590-1480(-)